METSVEKNDFDQTLIVKTKPINNQIDVDPNNLGTNFLFVYKSVTEVLRDRGLI